MILKTGSIPYKLLGLKALQRRLSVDQSRDINLTEQIRIANAGINGERVLEATFNKYQLIFEHGIYHGLNLKSTGFFQIDNLFLSRQGAFILEVKNIRGRIGFSMETNQLIRTLENGQIDSFECPSIQLKRNSYLLEDWLNERNIFIPIRTAVVFPNPRQFVENTRPDLNIFFPNEIPAMLRELELNSPALDLKTFSFISKELLKGHSDYNPYPMRKSFRINKDDIRTGVECENCGFLGMERIFRGWGYPACKTVSRTAHLQAIKDWFMLISDTMTNRECRDFLHVDKNYTASRLLEDLPLERHGENRGSYYRFPLERIT